ncbi:MAG: hypothetical protein QOH47_1816 [Sphingomonadales bacterium]|jgi:hypothetical protein|nr:hypothetical protein [Sphingomonadales bacterium]
MAKQKPHTGLIEVETRQGKAWINPIHVAAVIAGENGAEIWLGSGDRLTTDTSAEAIATRITEAALTLRQIRAAVE